MNIFRLTAFGIWLAAALHGPALADGEADDAGGANTEIVVGLLSLGAGLAPTIAARQEPAPTVVPSEAGSAANRPNKRATVAVKKGRSRVDLRGKRPPRGMDEGRTPMNLMARALDQNIIYHKDTKTADAEPAQYFGF